MSQHCIHIAFNDLVRNYFSFTSFSFVFDNRQFGSNFESRRCGNGEPIIDHFIDKIKIFKFIAVKIFVGFSMVYVAHNGHNAPFNYKFSWALPKHRNSWFMDLVYYGLAIYFNDNDT